MTRLRMRQRVGRRDARECRVHRAAMLDLLDDPRAGRLDAALVEALRRCDRCRAEIQEILLGSYAVQRAWRVASAAEPPGGTWPRLREMTRRPRGDAWRGRAHVLGICMSAFLVAVLSSSQLGAAIQPGAGAVLSEPDSAATADRHYDSVPRAAPSLPTVVETPPSGAHLVFVPSRKVVRTLAVDRLSARDASLQAPPVKPARSVPDAKNHPVTL